jgi:preprotein translocase subunit SecD
VHRNALRRIRDDVRAALRSGGVRHDGLRISGSTLRFRVLDAAAVGLARDAVARTARALHLTPSEQMPGLAVQAAPDGAFSVQLTGFGLAALHDDFMAASMHELQRRLAGSSFDHYLLSDDGGRIRLVLPHLARPEPAGRQC